MNFSTYDEAVDFILNIPRFTTKNKPEDTKAFLERIGDVSDFIPTVHIAGTNGKGSVSSYIKAGLNMAGYSVGMFTSPHLVDIRERFVVNSEMISKAEFLNVANYISDEINEMHNMSGYSNYHPTFFEYMFFMSMVWFKSKRPDYIILETGLGGRLDATNSIKNPVVTVITEIGLDHMEYLGETKELIAFEKAGIIKPHKPVVYADRESSVSQVIEKQAGVLDAPFYGVNGQNIKILERSPERIDFSMVSRYDELAILSLNTRASYQIENACLAYEAILYINDSCNGKINLNKVREGFSHMTWPGRMEKVKDNLVVDGAHNEDGIKAFLDSVAKDNMSSRSLLYSAVSDKQIETVADHIKKSGLFDRIYLCHLDSYRASDSDRLKNAFEGTEFIYFDTVKEALHNMLKDDSSMKYAAGSLYLVAELYQVLRNHND